MSDSRVTTTTRHWVGFALALLAAGVGGCGADDGTITIDPTGYDGVPTDPIPMIALPCVINAVAGTMTVQVQSGETVYLTLRAADNKVVADGVTSSSAECAVPPTYKIAITEDPGHPGVEKVFLDYINGSFAVGATVMNVATPGITVALGAGSSMVVRGSGVVDKVSLGSTYVASALSHSWININGDTSPDVRFDGVTDVKVSTGPGNDIISADGGNGTTGVSLDATITFSAYGGPDNDTLTGGKGASLLDGGDGDDLFLQTATVAADTIVGGKGTDTVDYGVRTTAVHVTICTTCSVDPCACNATDTTCASVATTAQLTCTNAATTAHTTCTGAATTAYTACTTGTGGCSDTEAACETACLGDAPCITACQADTTCTDACTATQATANATCDATQTAANTTCATTFATATTACTATQTTCQTTCATAACSACLADDGAASEGDTVNDDVEIVFGGKGDDTISAAHAVCSNAATVPVIRCTLKGNDGNDTLTGSPFSDVIDGGSGDDVMQGGQGNDTFVGGAGTDTVSYAERTNPVKVSLDAAHLWVAGQNGEVGELDVIGADIENLTGGGGADFLRGSAGNNIIHGGAGGDTIEGGAGNDALYGEGGADFLYGGAGNDFLVGGAGADTLVGGDGDDLLDATDTPATADAAMDCDGVNDSAGTAGTSTGTSDALVKDGSDVGALHCEL